MNKKNRSSHLVHFVFPADYSVKIKVSKNIDLARELKKTKTKQTMEHVSDADISYSW